jgi:hypothetical protein
MVETLYKVVNGTSYHTDTHDEVVNVLENAMANHIRIRVYYGDAKTGRDWDESYDVTGYVGRSTGKVKVPLLVYNSRSLGGTAILDHCIVKIVRTAGKSLLYQHPNYHLLKKDKNG